MHYKRSRKLRIDAEKALGFFLLLFLFFSTCPVYAQQSLPDSVEAREQESVGMALRYYDRCMKVLFKDSSLESRRGFCGCTGETARKNLSPEQLKFLALGEGENIEIDKKKLFVDIYGPCLHEILRSVEYEDCRYNKTNQHFFNTPQALDDMCQCMTDGAMKFAEQYGRDMMAVIMVRQPKVEDPVEALRSWNDYKEERNKWRKQCLSEYAYH